ncbi:MAG: TIGR03960 family B12-binding radical SAM protein [Clostridia bacterium]|nr:TIGR03960 family B12-binding radical SAM protein [Clostridia bacterium]
MDMQKIERMLEKVQKPARYMGGEMNTQLKPWEEAEVRFAFGFPDSYEVAMSHLGMKILYALINEQPWALCERVCMPWVDMIAEMEREGVELFSLESRKPLKAFDIVGFTLQYEMSYTNILEMLRLSNIPVWSRDRSEADPLIVCGGPCAFNPEPLAEMVDAFMIGDGEEVMLELLEVVRRHKQHKTSKADCLKELARLEGVYVPSLYEVVYNEDGTIKHFGPVSDAAPAKVVKRIVRDFDQAYCQQEIPVPYTEIVHDRIMLEIMRGCTRGCRFCQAGMLYRPVRERSVERLVSIAKALEKSTGYEEISLSSLSSGDYSCLLELTQELTQAFKDKRVSLSLPSLRLDSESSLKESLQETQKVKKSGLTFAPEAGTQRLRDVINKGVTEADLMRTVNDAFQGGWSSIKLYFMIGLPTETYEDLDGMGVLADKVVKAYFDVPKSQRAKGLRVVCSASSFVPKPFTPFQWAPQDTLEEIKNKHAHLRQVLKIKGVTFNWHEPELSFIEACFARGDRRMGKVLHRAWELGCRLDGWTEHFKFDKWLQAFEDCGLDPEFYANREREKDEILPWDFVDAGVTKAFLWKENERALAGVVTPDCRKGCQGCGLKRFEGVCVNADDRCL